MKTIFLLLLFTITIYANIFDVNRSYVGSALSIQSIEDYEKGIALVANSGIPFDMQDTYGVFGIEGELSYSAVAPTYVVSGSANDNKERVKLGMLGGYGTYTYDITKELYSRVRFGVVYYSVKDSDIDDGTERSFTFGGGYRYKKALRVFIDYTIVDKLSELTCGIQYNFKASD